MRREGLERLLRHVRATFAHAAGSRPVLDVGYFANVVPVGGGLGVAISTDGVGTKLLVAQAVGRFDTIGIDCVAMNVNDIVCVGARPVAMVDYIALEESDPDVLDAVGLGLAAGCKEAGVTCPGGELAKVPEMLRGARPGRALDLVGTAIGTVPLDRVIDGSRVEAGDVLLGLESSGLHSNGYTLARRTLLERGGLDLEAHVPEFGTTLADEMLRPTRIYVRAAAELLDAGVDVRALAHVTGDGLFNLVRTAKPIGFDIERWPEVPPIFTLIQRIGALPDEVMFSEFNMGIGFTVVVPEHAADAATKHLDDAGHRPIVLGRATIDLHRTINLRPRTLTGRAHRFIRT